MSERQNIEETDQTPSQQALHHILKFQFIASQPMYSVFLVQVHQRGRLVRNFLVVLISENNCRCMASSFSILKLRSLLLTGDNCADLARHERVGVSDMFPG